jgi:hypothetical protein
MNKSSTTAAFACAVLCGSGLLPTVAHGQVAMKDKTSVSVLKQAPPRSVDAPIEVLAFEPQGRPFEQLCIITATGGQTIAGSKKGTDMIEPMKNRARTCGADALIIKSTSDQTIKPLRGGIDRGARAEAVAIRYLEVEAAPVESPAAARPQD